MGEGRESARKKVRDRQGEKEDGPDDSSQQQPLRGRSRRVPERKTGEESKEKTFHAGKAQY